SHVASSLRLDGRTIVAARRGPMHARLVRRDIRKDDLTSGNAPGAKSKLRAEDQPPMSATEQKPLRVLLGVTGGIAAYKSPEIVRRLVERGCEVQVVMSGGAKQFVGPLTFEAVSGRRVRDDLFDADAEAAMGHIELARWADVVLVAPATAHFLGTLAAGLRGGPVGQPGVAT